MPLWFSLRCKLHCLSKRFKCRIIIFILWKRKKYCISLHQKIHPWSSYLKHDISCADLAQLSYLWKQTSCISISLFGIIKFPWKTNPLVEIVYELKCLSIILAHRLQILTHNTARYTTSHHVQVLFMMFCFLLLILIKVSIKHV